MAAYHRSSFTGPLLDTPPTMGSSPAHSSTSQHTPRNTHSSTPLQRGRFKPKSIASCNTPKGPPSKTSWSRLCQLRPYIQIPLVTIPHLPWDTKFLGLQSLSALSNFLAFHLCRAPSELNPGLPLRPPHPGSDYRIPESSCKTVPGHSSFWIQDLGQVSDPLT